MDSLFQRYTKYMERAKADGWPVTSYACPHCQKLVESCMPSKGLGPWDTLTSCPHCEGLAWKVVYDDGRVEISVPAAEEQEPV